MKKEYNFSSIKSHRDPYASKLKKPITIRLSEEVIGYFKEMSEESNIPYLSLINRYLRDCATIIVKLIFSGSPTS